MGRRDISSKWKSKTLDTAGEQKAARTKSSFWLIFRAPESVIAFLSGAFVSAAINIFTDSDADTYRIVAAVLMLIISALFVVWTVCARPLDEKYRSAKQIIDEQSGADSKYPTKFWCGILDNNPKNKRVLIGIFIALSVLILAAVGFLVLPRII